MNYTREENVTSRIVDMFLTETKQHFQMCPLHSILIKAKGSTQLFCIAIPSPTKETPPRRPIVTLSHFATVVTQSPNYTIG